MTVKEDCYASRTTGNSGIIERLDPVVYGEDKIKEKNYLDTAALTHYRDKGYLFFENVFSRKEISRLLEELDILKSNPDRERNEAYITEPGSGEVRSIFQIHETSPVFNLLARDERLLNIAQQILDGQVYMHQSRINLKRGFRGKEFYWHSDFETWHMEDGMPRMRALSCSIALTDNYAFNGPLMVIPGSHQKYVVCAGETPENHYKQSLKKQEYGVPGDKELQVLVDNGGIQAPTGPAGSVIFFDCNTMHGSNGNITPFSRTNVFFVYNSTENRLAEPFGGLTPRPEHIAARKNQEILQPVLSGKFTESSGSR